MSSISPQHCQSFSALQPFCIRLQHDTNHILPAAITCITGAMHSTRHHNV